MVDNKNPIYILYFFLTLVRAAFWLYVSYLIKADLRAILKEYFRLDNIQLQMYLTAVAYGFLNKSSNNVWVILAIVAFPILHGSDTCMIRVMVNYGKWTRARMVTFKLIRMYGCGFYLFNGAVTIYNPPAGLDSDMNLLYIFTTLSFLCEVYFYLVEGYDKIKEDNGFVSWKLLQDIRFGQNKCQSTQVRNCRPFNFFWFLVADEGFFLKFIDPYSPIQMLTCTWKK